MQRETRTPTYTRDHDGAEIALVPLANHDSPAKILKEDFEALLSRGFPANWTLNESFPGLRYVRCAVNSRRGNLATVARLLLDPPRGRIVKYRDGNRLNLRRDNLFLTEGRATGVTMKDESPDAAI